MVVCSGAGIKKIYVSVSQPGSADHEVTVKHCSNTPLAIATEETSTLQHLAYPKPITPTLWESSDATQISRDWLRNGKPPPGRAPPTRQSA